MKEGTMDTEYAIKAAELNDEFRRSRNGVTITRGVQALDYLPELLDEVVRFNDFTESNDPYGEHDFGKITWCGQVVFWKIDYYDQDLRYGEDPLSPDCRRVLTVMLASEY